jgi:divalent metal cation (Fe/Co/Zn/Cd) transporter
MSQEKVDRVGLLSIFSTVIVFFLKVLLWIVAGPMMTVLL